MRDYFDRPDVFGQEASKHGRRAGRDRLVAAAGLVIACCVVGALLAIALLGSLRL